MSIVGVGRELFWTYVRVLISRLPGQPRETACVTRMLKTRRRRPAQRDGLGGSTKVVHLCCAARIIMFGYLDSTTSHLTPKKSPLQNVEQRLEPVCRMLWTISLCLITSSLRLLW